MTISTHITRLTKAIALGLALMALAVPAAQAGDRRPRDTSADPATVLPQNFRGDDYFREAPAAETILPQNFRGDDYFRDGTRDMAYEQVPVDGWYHGLVASASPETILPADFRGDDYFRDGNEQQVPVDGWNHGLVAAASPETILPADFRGDDWYRDAKDTQVAAPLTVLPAYFLGDDHFRDAIRNAAPQSSSDGFGWRDFGIGASSMLGALALLGALSSIALTARRGSRRLGRI
jgi:hypothetical protein